jgi:hypothetical protein
MAFEYYAQVERAHSELVAEGLIKPRHDQEQVEQDKGLLTRRAGYYCYTEDSPLIGLLEKLEGNNSLGYSVDLLLRLSDGTFWDVATDRDGQAIPLNGGPGGPDPELVPRWRKPSAELAQIGEEGSGQDLTSLAPPFDDAKAVEFGLACNDTYTESGATPDPGMIAVHAQRCAYSYYVAGMPWPQALLKHTNEFRAEYGLPPLSVSAASTAAVKGRPLSSRRRKS